MSSKRMLGYVVRSGGVWCVVVLLDAAGGICRFRRPDAMAVGFSVLVFPAARRPTVPAGTVGSKFLVKGKYVVFTVDSASFGVRDWTLTGAPNPLDLTGELPTIVFASRFLIIEGWH